jgi:hypothetical protein
MFPAGKWRLLRQERKADRTVVVKKRLQVFVPHLLVILTLCACATTVPAGFTGSGGEPNWVRDPYQKYDRQANVAAVGFGSSRELAEKSALGNLIAVFGQSIRVDETVSSFYAEAVRNGVVAGWSDSTSVDTVILTSAGMDALIGAEIGEVWHNSRGEYYAAAFLNKAKASQLYTGIVRSNLSIIDRLTDIPPEEKNSLDGFARYQFAAALADVTYSYAYLLSVIGSPVQGLKSGNDYRLEAKDITNAIPVGIRVQNDKAGRIEGAFAKAFSDAGFRSGGGNSRYVLDANVVTSPVDIAGNPNKFTRIELASGLSDTNTGMVLLPFNFNSREGHTTQAEADNRAYASAERKINEEYANLLKSYLSALLPK